MAKFSVSRRADGRRAIEARYARRGERGGVVVEFALISPLLFFLLAAIIDYGLVFNDYQQIRSGVREGARIGAVNNFGNTNNCTLAAMQGNPSPDMRSLMCSTKKYIGKNHNEVRVKIMFSDGALVASTPNAFVPGNALIVCSMSQQESTTGMLDSFFANKALKAKTAIRIEQLPLNLQEAGAEQPLPGTDWNWCSTPDQVSP